MPPVTYTRKRHVRQAEDKTNILASATRNGVPIDTAGTDAGETEFDEVRVTAQIDRAGVLAVEQSSDLTTWRRLDSANLVAATPLRVTAKVVLRYVRAVVVNSDGANPAVVAQFDTLAVRA